MVNTKPNTRIFDVFFNNETPASLPTISPLEHTWNQAKGLIILSLAFAIGAFLFISFKHDSKVILLKTPRYLAMDVRFFQKVWLILQYVFHIYIWYFKTKYDNLMVLSKLPSNQDWLIYLHCDLGSLFIFAAIMIQIWPLQGDIQFEGDGKARMTPYSS